MGKYTTWVIYQANAVVVLFLLFCWLVFQPSKLTNFWLIWHNCRIPRTPKVPWLCMVVLIAVVETVMWTWCIVSEPYYNINLHDINNFKTKLRIPSAGSWPCTCPWTGGELEAGGQIVKDSVNTTRLGLINNKTRFILPANAILLRSAFDVNLTSQPSFLSHWYWQVSWAELNCCELFVANLWRQNSYRIRRKYDKVYRE